MSKQYDYILRFNELQSGIDNTFKTILKPFIFDNIEKYQDESAKILDVGCGCGFLTTQIANHFSHAEVEGIDISEDAIACAKMYSNVKFVVSDIVNFNTKQEYDILIYNMVLHNVENIQAAIKCSYNLLKNNGIVIITIPHPVFWLQDKISRKKIKLQEPFVYKDEKWYQIPFQIANGEKHPSFLQYYHRTIETYIKIFLSCSFDIKLFEEVDVKNGNPTMLRIVLLKK